MTENEFILADRIAKIQSTIEQYGGEDKFYIAFSGGKDSTVLSALCDMALPGNRMPRVYSDTGIELNMIRQFVLDMQKHDDRVVILKPRVPVTKMLQEVGYPFKSKLHGETLDRYQRCGMMPSVEKYLSGEYGTAKQCPKVLIYQFTPEFKLRVSDRCCHELKKAPMREWELENKRVRIVGVMADEGGIRKLSSKCIVFKHDKLRAFQPMTPLTKEWEEWFIKEHNVKICDIYYPPYNFERTGCKGCPFNIHLQRELDTLEKLLPRERKQCELIWKPVYDEYRRIGYRLKKTEEYHQVTMDEWRKDEFQGTV